MPKPFGRSLLLDLYNCRKGAADDLELCYRFLEEAVDVLKMTKNGQPYVIHGPRTDGQELYPDKLGVSGFIALIESGITIHSVEPTRFVTIDIYTCGELNVGALRQLALRTFGPENHEEHFVERGTRYPS